MYTRIITVKLPNETATDALKLLYNNVSIEQMKVGLLSSTIVDVNKTNFILIKSWISKKHFDQGRKNWKKFSNETKEMGAIVSGVGGESKNISLDTLKNYLNN